MKNMMIGVALGVILVLSLGMTTKIGRHLLSLRLAKLNNDQAVIVNINTGEATLVTLDGKPMFLAENWYGREK